MTSSVLATRDRLGVAPRGFFIDGGWRAAKGGLAFAHIHPATNETVAMVPSASAEEVDTAVRAARRAFDEGAWGRMKARERRQLLRKVVDVLYAHHEEIAHLQTLDNGVPINFSLNTRISTKHAAEIFDHYIGWIDKIVGETYPRYTEDAALQFLSMREPVGVVAAVLPWNAPVMMFALKVAPALATGCTVVVKPSEYASLCALRLVELVNGIGLPDGVLNLVTGGPETGAALTAHPMVDKITFTGSKATGGRILDVAGRDIKRVTLELGGKSAALVFPDAVSVEGAATMVMAQSSTFLSGQVCSTTSRALVHRSIYDRFVAACEKQVESVRFGDPFDGKTTSAPIINTRQVEKIMGYIGKGREEGGRLVFGGDRPDGPLVNGNWINPTLFADVDNRMTIAREEIFGPVLAVIPFDSEDEAIRLANDSEYGLSGGLYTSNVSRAFRVAKAMRTGSVGINGYSVMPNSPAGGVKASGIGREGGWATIEAFTEIKTLIVNEAM